MERKHPLAECENCPLFEGGKFCPSAGAENASLVVVGDVPSVADVRSGEPFTGPAARLFKHVTDYHGFDAEEIFYTHACLCRPQGISAPPKAAIVACRPRLLAEIENHRVGELPVVALGNGAALALLDQEKVMNLRVGPPKQSPYGDFKVVPTVHPAACMRQADQFPNVILDVGKVKADVQPWREPDYVVSEGVDHAVALLDAIDERATANGTPLVVDIEVDVEKDTAFDHPNQYGMLCVGICYERGKSVVLSEGDMASERVRDRLADLLGSHNIIAQNGKFDLAGLYPLTGRLKLWFDTMLASYVFDERPGIHGLKYQAVEYLGAPKYDEVLSKYVTSKTGYGVIPRPILYKYNAYDTVCTWMLWEMYEEKFKESPELRRVHDFLVAASNELMFVELNGFTVDRQYLRQLDGEYKEILQGIREEMNGIVKTDYDKFGGINPNSPLQIKKALADWHIKVDSTNEDTLTVLLPKLQEGSDPERFVKALMKHRTQAKAHGTYVKGIEKRLYRGRVYSTYLLHGTTTGRLSSRNPNLQNIPRDKRLRKIFVAGKEENVLVHTDFSQAELRVLSFLAQDTYFRDIFNDESRDLFDELTPVLYPGATKDLFTPAEWKEKRIRVKAYVYGLSYGRTEHSIASEFGIPVKEAREGMHRFFDVIPEIVEFREQTKAKVWAGEDLVTPWGRHRRYALITKENEDSIMNEALAFLPQSTASDMCLNALTKLRPELAGVGYIRNTIHDAIIVECNKKDAEEVGALMRQRMIESAQTIVGDYVKFDADTTYGRSWGDL